MRTESESQAFRSEAETRIRLRCDKCGGKDPECECVLKFQREADGFDACVPKDFWHVEDMKIEHNVGAFETRVIPYCKRLRNVRYDGYGMFLSGDNGVGKTTFASYVLMRAMRNGWTGYYTTLPKLDHDIKRGFGDDTARDRLEWYLGSDFVVIDEVAKERFKGGPGDSYTRMQVERILKQRYDDSAPVILATNATIEEIGQAYGKTISSVITGKYLEVMLSDGDQRERSRERMEKKILG
ncbi:hypothetical protein LCGC14_1569160 [marine sediment metagenome]|uniref:IstB-like ATP-binding domain-containing protein n=1 Tax=marine sediment metagenome TaxID=412755 RepID=A0A0F9LKQ6_9ZZZZ